MKRIILLCLLLILTLSIASCFELIVYSQIKFQQTFNNVDKAIENSKKLEKQVNQFTNLINESKKETNRQKIENKIIKKELIESISIKD